MNVNQAREEIKRLCRERNETIGYADVSMALVASEASQEWRASIYNVGFTSAWAASSLPGLVEYFKSYILPEIPAKEDEAEAA